MLITIIVATTFIIIDRSAETITFKVVKTKTTMAAIVMTLII